MNLQNNVFVYHLYENLYTIFSVDVFIISIKIHHELSTQIHFS